MPLISLEILMDTNPYDRNSQWTPQQHQVFQNKPVEAQNSQQSLQPQNQKLPQRSGGQKPGTQAKMPKARALALANALKRTLAVASIIGFGMFGGLVAMHQVGTTTTSSTQSTSGSSNTSSKSNSSSQNSNSFLNQQGGNTSGTSSTTSSSTSSTPVTGTSTS
jgi:hypothetical protein